MENGQPKIERKKHLTPFIMNDRPILTYQTRPVVSVDQGAVLDAYAALYGQAIKVIAKLVVRASGSNKLHQKRRRLAMMQARLASMQADEAAARVRLCFGSKKLFRAQYAPEANGFDSHADCYRP